VRGRGSRRPRIPDWLPPLVNAGRAFVVIGAAQLFWIITAWPNGAGAMTFAAIGVILLAPRADQAYGAAIGFTVGTGLTAVFAAIVGFAVLPNLETFAAFSLAIGLVLVPAGTGLALASPSRMVVFMAMVANFVPLLAPANQENYDTQQFYNSAMAIVGGSVAAALSFRLLPPLSPAFRTRRLLALTLRDLYRLVTGPIPRTVDDWTGRMYGRLSVLPDAAQPLQRSQLLAAFAVGTAIIRLRQIWKRFDLGSGLDAALEPLAQGRSVTAVGRLASFDQALAARPDLGPEAMRARSLILAISEALTQHSACFDAGVPG
jgi:uncharacterized membrane protein YccC